VSAKVDKAVIEALGGGDPPRRMLDLRRATGIGAEALIASVTRLRYRGMIEWGRLELRPSMIEAASAGSGQAEDPAQAPDRTPPEEDAAAPARIDAAASSIRNGEATINQVRAAVAGSPIAEQVHREAVAAGERRRVARMISPKVVERSFSAVEAGRATGEAPAAALYRAIERGLDGIEREVAHG
jgi:hypothetical protein